MAITDTTATDPTPTRRLVRPMSLLRLFGAQGGGGRLGAMSTARCDVAVIGAGPAGAATAIRAARGGARVTVFEKGVAGPRQGVRRRPHP